MDQNYLKKLCLTATVSIKDKNGKTVRKQSKFWYVDYKTVEGTRKRVKGFRDKSATVQLAAELEKKAELARAGIIDRYAEDRKKPLREHLEDFYQALLAKGDTVEHAQQTKYRVQSIIDGCKFVVWTDISASKGQQYLADLRSKENGISAQTFNYYLQSIKQFCRWMVQDGRASESPIAHLTKINAKTDRRHDRRALEPDEMRRLLETTARGPKRFGMQGYERALLYRLAVESGLRRKELQSLKVSSFDLERRTVTVSCAYTKNKIMAVLPLKADTAAELRSFSAGKMPNVKAFGGTYKQLTNKTADMLKADLADAGIPYVDDAERYADFHCLRHTTGTLLAASGVHPKVAQSIMRHCDINLTMSLYTHTLRGQESEAVESLPDLSLPSKEGQKVAGTDDRPVKVDSGAYKKLTKNPYSDSPSASLIGNTNDVKKQECSHIAAFDKSLRETTLGTKEESLSPNVTDLDPNAPGRARTCNLRIRSPALYPVELRAQTNSPHTQPKSCPLQGRFGQYDSGQN